MLSDVMRVRTSRTTISTGLILSGLIVVGGFWLLVGCNSDDEAGKPGTLAEYIPPGTFVYLSFDTDNIAAMNTFYNDLVDLESYERYKQGLLSMIPELTGLQIDFETLADILATGTADWFDTEIAVVVGTGIADGRPEVALWLDITDEDDAIEGFPELLDDFKGAVAANLADNPGLEQAAFMAEHFSFSFTEEDHQGTIVYSMPVPGKELGFHWAATDEALIVGVDRRFVLDCIDGFEADEPHERVDDFLDAYDVHLGANPLMWIYCDAEAGRDLLRRAGSYGDIPRQVRAELEAVSGILLSVNSHQLITTTGLTAIISPENVAKTEFLKTALTWEPAEHELDPFVHRGSAPFYCSLNNAGDITRFIINKIGERDPYGMSRAKENIRESTGHSLDTIVAAIGDEMGFAFHDIEVDIMGVVMGREDAVQLDVIAALDIRDVDVIHDLLKFSMSELPKISDGVMGMTRLDDNHYVVDMTEGDYPNAPTIVIEDSRLLIGIGFDDVPELAATPQGETIEMQSNLKFVVDWKAIAAVSSKIITELEGTKMFKHMMASSPENEAMFRQWKLFLTDGLNVYGRTTETLVISEDEITFLVVQTMDEVGLKNFPYDALLEIHKEQLLKLAEYLGHRAH